MEIKVISNEQTPKIDEVNIDINNYINNHQKELQAFLEYAITRRNVAGLAANQCSIDEQRFMVRGFALRSQVDPNKCEIIINPKVMDYIGMKEIKIEGCLTWKGQYVVAERSRAVKVRYYDIDGQLHIGIFKGFQGQVWQHEINHLNGVEEVIKETITIPHQKKIERNEPCPCGAVELELDVFVLHQKYEEGKTLEEIGKLIDKSGKTIGRMFKKHGLHIRTKSENKIGEKNNSFNPNPIYTKDGYVEIWNGKKRELEHRFVMKEHLKRELLGIEIIHHINGIKDDNRLVNLKIVTSSSHRKEHKLPKEQWSKNYECCIKCGTTNKKHAGNGYCSKCYMYVRTVEKRGYECEYDEEGNRNFSEEHVENLKKSAIVRERKKKYKKCCLLLI
ncbi:MAG: peptide deformylase [Bacteroidales bacterium]|jgi:peptide deformylase|nr:peptide deformylase [Bacteroidales bacterium]